MFKTFIAKVFGFVPIEKQDIINNIEEQDKLLQQQIDNQQQHQEQDLESSVCCFVLSPDANISIRMALGAGINPKYFGKLLYKINSGELAKAMHDNLVGIVRENPNSYEYVNQIFDGWESEIEKKDDVIKPSEVFKPKIMEHE